MSVDNQSKQMSLGKLANRRRLLQLGAAGLPMMLTLRAGASSTVISQLSCTLDVPSDWLMMVKDDGSVWMGSSINYNGETLTDEVVQNIKDASDFEFAAGSAPEEYWPTEDDCEDDGDDGDDSGGKKGKGKDNDDDGCDDSDDSYASLSLPANATLSNERWAETLTPSGAVSSLFKGDDDCEEDDNCGVYKVYVTSGVTSGIDNYVDESGNWTIPESAEGLYVTLAKLYLQDQGLLGEIPGISCLHSVLTYFNQL